MSNRIDKSLGGGLAGSTRPALKQQWLVETLQYWPLACLAAVKACLRNNTTVRFCRTVDNLSYVAPMKVAYIWCSLKLSIYNNIKYFDTCETFKKVSFLFYQQKTNLLNRFDTNVFLFWESRRLVGNHCWQIKNYKY